MKTTYTCLLVAAALAVGCKKKDERREDVAPLPTATGSAAVIAPDAAPVGVEPGSGSAPGAATPGDIAFATDEGYFGGAVSKTNVHEWKLDDGSQLRLVVVQTGKPENGRQRGVLRVYRDGKGVDVGSRFDVANDGSYAELKQLANGRVLFRYGDTGTDRRALNAVILRYDNDAKEVRVVKRWTGAAKSTEPTWLATGEYKPAASTKDSCAKVVARMKACAKDEAFRSALAARDATTRDTLLATFDKDAGTWGSPAGIGRQCERWASDDYVETTLSDEAKLAHLAKEASDPKVSCEFFGREIVDEGGFPQLAGK
ncbi:MAG TPA: hypothetical protein VK427_03525 [Kofleriaceae bacterium]|nr:hypothetical protein [Kofleriaceae bacterium]